MQGLYYCCAGGYHPYYRPYWYDPFYRPYRAYRYDYYRPTKLDLQIEDIKNDYDDKIWSVRHNEEPQVKREESRSVN